MKKFLATMLAVVACVGLASCTPKKVVNNANNGNTAVGLVSEKVANATAWQNAFDGLHTHFTLDVKMETPYTYDDTTKTDYAETTTITMIAKGDEMSANAKEFALYEDGTVVDDYVEETYLKKVDGTYYQWFRNDGTYGEFTEVGEWEETATRLDCTNWNDWLPETGMMTTDVFADKYELFSYDETEKVYVYNDNVQTGFSEMAESAFDNTGFGLDDAETLCYKVWIKDGKVAKVYVELKCLDGYDEGEQASYTPKLSITYTFGVGEPNLPEFVMPE